MSGDVVPQVDIGALTIRGLSGFVPLLAAFTADDVSPMAMIQLENLGSLFHVSGEYAATVPDLLQRTPSQRLDNLGMVIGWRKGDAASTLAQSAGGQAIALVSLCIRSLYSYEATGSIMYQLSQRALPRNLAISSIAQLARVADMLFSKMSKMGFGNVLAKLVSNIQDACTALGTSCPSEFFESPTSEAVVDLLYSLSRVFCEEDCIVRIFGTQGMSLIATIVTILFPEDLELYVAGILLYQGPRRSMSVEIDISGKGLITTHVSVEKQLHDKPISKSAITVETGTKVQWKSSSSFKWPGHLSDILELEFSTSGVSCRPELHSTCCALLHAIATSVSAQGPGRRDTSLPEGGLQAVLGPRSLHRIRDTYTSIFRVSTYKESKTVTQACDDLVDEFERTLKGHIRCTCWECDPSGSWEESTRKAGLVTDCTFQLLWQHLRRVIFHGFTCLLIEASSDSVIRFHDKQNVRLCDFIDFQVGRQSHQPYFQCEDIHNGLLSSMRPANHNFRDVAAISDGASTLIPRSLMQMEMEWASGVRYLLYDGQLVFGGRYYKQLHCAGTMARGKAEASLRTSANRVQPSYHGEHSSVIFSVKESIEGLQLRTTLQVLGHRISVSLARILVASMGATDAEYCEHPRSEPLILDFGRDVYTSSVAYPRASDGRISIVQTMGNPTAQLFACETSARTLVQRNCCLNCAIFKCKKGGFDQVVVGC